MEITQLLNPQYDHLLLDNDTVVLMGDNFIYQGGIYIHNKIYYNSKNGMIILNNLDEYLQYRNCNLNQNHIAIKRKRSWYVFHNQILHMVVEKLYPLQKYFIQHDIIMAKNKNNDEYIIYDNHHNVLIYKDMVFGNLISALRHVYGNSTLTRYKIVRGIQHIDMGNMVPDFQDAILAQYQI